MEKNRRILKSESNSHLVPLLSLAIHRTLVNDGQDSCTEDDILEVLYGRRNSLGFICKTCYIFLNGYYKKQQDLMEKTRKVIQFVSFCNVDDVPVGSKRHSRGSTSLSSSKRPKPSNAHHGIRSPDVEVTACHILISVINSIM